MYFYAILPYLKKQNRATSRVFCSAGHKCLLQIWTISKNVPEFGA